MSAEAVQDVGLQPGDRVLSIAGAKVEDFSDIISILNPTNGEPQLALVDRGGETRQITVRYRPAPRVTQVVPGMPAARAGMLGGDVILSIDGQPIGSFRELQLNVAAKPAGTEMKVEVRRDGELMVFDMVPELVERTHPDTGEIVLLPTMGINSSEFAGVVPVSESVSVPRALMGGVTGTWRIISGTMIYIGDMIFKGADTSQLGGPIRIAEISGDAAEQGFSSLIWLIAVLSTSIGLINLFPIPVLDGGHLMFYAVELVRGRPVGEMWMKVGTMIGLSLVLLLMVFATYNDLLRL
jgi:regulator of sigma E protease